MSGKIVSRYCQQYRVRVDDFRLLAGTPAQKRALAAAARQGRDVKQTRGEAPQSGPKGNAQPSATSHGEME